ncbi:hypothetical protein [Winogradskyella sp. UBA3174]|uniref:hypothetical protein n=1 Tax=Winogradskyella sp. UBA3174 TaxID=1947785 RepID=UPI0025D64651|nr:hypothetical protein [Winogradskyella sp. UBA3174]|tara:strand:- start:1497 stop:2012 length:516 start_codon:yes stop_codon:yes gene_type:complete
MKFLLSLFAIALLTLSCDSSKQSITDTDKATTNSKNNASIVQTRSTGDYYNTKSVTYTTSSRTSFEYIDISESKIAYSTDRNLIEIDTFNSKKGDWQDIKRLLREIDTQTISNLKAPTDKRLYDGAAHATLSLREGDILFETPTFDEGEPPTKIKELVNKVLSIKESVLKQ